MPKFIKNAKIYPISFSESLYTKFALIILEIKNLIYIINGVEKIMSENEKDFHNLSLKISKTLLKELNTELVIKFGRTYGHMADAIREGIKMWVNAQKRERSESK